MSTPDLFQPSSCYTSNNNETESQEYFTLIDLTDIFDKEGNPKTKEDSKYIFAKKTLRKDGSIKYAILLSNQNKLYNPMSIYDPDKSNHFLEKVCRSNSRFIEVNQKTFDYYLGFLKTKNTALLSNAERERE